MKGTIYLLHFNSPLAHARHYMGWTGDLPARLEHHAKGTGARLMAAVGRAGIGWQLARTWTGDRHQERHFKEVHRRLSGLCPLCKPGNITHGWANRTKAN